MFWVWYSGFGSLGLFGLSEAPSKETRKNDPHSLPPGTNVNL